MGLHTDHSLHNNGLYVQMFCILAELNWEYPAECTEEETKVLLQVKAFTDGTIELQPPINLGADPATSKQSRRKGTYKFHDNHGGLYEYSVRLHGQAGATDQQTDRKECLWHFHEQAHIQHARRIQLGTLAPPRCTRLLIQGDIVSAEGFPHDRLYIEFALRFPKSVWKLKGPKWLQKQHKRLNGAFENDSIAHVCPPCCLDCQQTAFVSVEHPGRWHHVPDPGITRLGSCLLSRYPCLHMMTWHAVPPRATFRKFKRFA
jgi:hypothetical protein